MKKFFLMMLLVPVFFTGLGAILQETAAKFKSDDRALALLQKARQAIGGDNAIAGINSLVITGRSTRTLKIDGVERTDQGDMEIALQYPDKMMKMIKIGHEDGTGEKVVDKIVDKRVDVVVVRKGEGEDLKLKTESGKAEGGKIVIKKDDGATEETQIAGSKNAVVRKVEGAPGEDVVFERRVKGEKGEFPRHNNELLRTSLALFLTAPQGMDVSYLYAGEGTVDGISCNIIEAKFDNTSIKLFLGKDSNLPVMMSYQGEPMTMMFKRKKADGETPVAEKDVKVFTRTAGPRELSEFQVRFSDYRTVGGVQLPFKWTQTVGGQPDEIVDVTGYEINPANIADKFKIEKRVHEWKAKENSN